MNSNDVNSIEDQKTYTEEEYLTLESLYNEEHEKVQQLEIKHFDMLQEKDKMIAELESKIDGMWQAFGNFCKQIKQQYERTIF